MRRFLIASVALLSLLIACRGRDFGGYTPRNGDVIFQSFPHSPLTDVIESVSSSPYSHCGVVVVRGNDVFVCEAIGPVQDMPLEAWIQRGRNQAFAVYRLNDRYQSKVGAFVEAVESYSGRPYDIHYQFDEEKIYCSELVFKAFKRTTGEELGAVKKLGDLNWKPNEAFIRQIEGGQLPLDREMITPKDLSEARQLSEVFQRGF